MKTCAIVILNYNGEEVLKTFLPSVVQFSTHDIWVIDNASTDGSLVFLEQTFPQISLIRLQANFGYAGGYNWGLESIKGEYEFLILLNSDVEVTSGWDAGLVGFLEGNPDYAAVQPKILSWKERGAFDYAGAGGGFLDALGYPYCRGRLWNHLEKDLGQYDDTIVVDWASGACLAIRGKDFFAMEGFDAHFFAHMEEIDLCWRLRKAGRKIGYLGAVPVFHQGGATLDRASPQKLYLNIRNSLSMLYKNEPGYRFMWIFVAKGFLEALGALGFLLSGKRENAQAIMKGYADFWRRKSLIQRQKKEPVREIPRSGPVNFLLGNVWLLGVRRFSDL
ncbi:MAG: glycosyltransferase family 2 protein [Algoriphagus aquaeductus]|uniref:glycosyltransferase family 2 protein n=1 Tax=Algoriphagus aquaeductus TaxID=475299 RepID=UPI00387A3343